MNNQNHLPTISNLYPSVNYQYYYPQIPPPVIPYSFFENGYILFPYTNSYGFIGYPQINLPNVSYGFNHLNRGKYNILRYFM